ncbi:hypothetical protein EYR38_002548 [Pleurotus pulmonarius]|nr:hypothetical protein EYR38_002548 [Pleurotus pulmonarius]
MPTAYHDPTRGVEERETLLYSTRKDETDQGLEGYEKDPSAVRLTLYVVGIVLLSFSSFATLHVLLYPTSPPMDPSNIFPELLYSPVEHLVSYKLVKFHTGFFEDEAPSVFDGPSTDSMDAAWTDLYDIYTYAISSLTTEENGHLADPTVPAFGNTSQLYGGLDVFHQLHCLVLAIPFDDVCARADLFAAKDYVRKALEPERYGGVDGRRASFMNKRKATADLPHVSTAEHVSHCLDMIRQSLMCSADISVISWYMPIPSSAEHTPNPLPRFDQTRMCRDFDRLRDWARSRTPDVEGLEGVMPHGHGEGH